jgi:inosine-uridine nucleoside N-ribohydrolase
VIVDYSPTVSDVGALLYLLSHPEVEVVGITLPVTGEAGCELGFDVTLGILAMFERADIPVACDPDVPDGAHAWPEEFLAGMNDLTLGLPEASSTSDDRPAHQLIADVAAGSDQPVVLYAAAPLTNVARVLDHHPEVADSLDRIVIMGGAVHAPGNVPGRDAEWNLWIDVPSAARVLGSHIPITLVPLDATNDVPVPVRWQQDLDAVEQTEAIVYLSRLVRTFPAVTSGFFYLWDELAASVAAAAGLVQGEELAIVVAEEPGAGYGGTDRDPSGAPILVANAVPDPDAFYDHFLSILSGAAA